MSDPLAPLMPRIAEGDRQALAELYRALEKPVFRFIRAKFDDPFASADLLHEVFMEVWHSAGTFEGTSTVRSWVFAIAYRMAAELRAEMTGGEDAPFVADDLFESEVFFSAGQESDMVRYCLGTLTGELREPIQLAFWEDMSCGEIAQVAGVSEGTVKIRMFQAKKQLLYCLEGLVRRAAS